MGSVPVIGMTHRPARPQARQVSNCTPGPFQTLIGHEAAAPTPYAAADRNQVNCGKSDHG
jgi:hypothetical protein